MADLKQAAQQALEALEELNGWQSLAPPLASQAGRQAAINLRAALEQPEQEQEPVSQPKPNATTRLQDPGAYDRGVLTGLRQALAICSDWEDFTADRLAGDIQDAIHNQMALERAEALRAALEQPEQCACGDRPKGKCPGEWEPGCDLGNNPKYARRVALKTPEEPRSSKSSNPPAVYKDEGIEAWYYAKPR